MLAATNTVISPRHRFTRASSLGILPLPQAMPPTIAAVGVPTSHGQAVVWEVCGGGGLCRRGHDLRSLLQAAAAAQATESTTIAQPFPGA